MTLTRLQENIKAKFEKSPDFFPYIDEVRFPMYKTLEDNLKIRLNWPIVALVGPNGTNKSSILQAISAAPEGRSLAQFWFSTEVDNIDLGIRRGATHRFVYKYRFDLSGVSAECRKYRGSKKYRSTEVPQPLRGKRDPDYWEPTKRVASDGMAEIPTSGFDAYLSNNRDRWNQIKKPVVYLDFRAELSAFDKYIHHQSFNKRTPDSTRKRHQVVVKSKLIARALAGGFIPKADREKLIREVRFLADEDVASIATILGKPIQRISVVEHSFFGPTGYTIKLHLSKSDTSYSEAHAGSGEYAVVRLVDAIRRAQDRSLILLDEPEVSLHPGAQIELLKFIEREVLSHGHQVVFSTHSPVLIEGLPSDAIKVLGFDNNKERVVLVADGCSHTEAFAHLGQATSSSTKPQIIVEDDLVEEMIKAALRRNAPHKLDNLKIIPFPGGAGGIVQNVLPSKAISEETNTGILLDGDQLPATASYQRDILKEANTALQAKDIESLWKIWKEQFHETELNLYSNSDHGLDPKTLYDCLKWSHKHLGFLPGKQPEQALAVAEKPELKGNSIDWKKYWRERAGEYLNLTDLELRDIPSKEILNYQRTVLANLPEDNALFRDITATVEHIVEW